MNENLFEKLMLDFSEDELDMRTRMNSDKLRLCHYTTASNAINILKSGQIWMRHPLCMNDVSEIRHGLEQINLELNSNNVLEADLNHIREGLFDEVQSEFKKYYEQAISEHFVFCFSEYDLETDFLGKLSMWRAYSGANGVCIVFRKDLFVDDGLDGDNDGDEPHLVKVRYTHKGVVKDWLDTFCTNLKNQKETLSQLPLEEAARTIAWLIRNYVLSAKHPAFEEESEWRLIYTDNQDGAKYLKREVEVIGGVAQEVFKFVLSDYIHNGQQVAFKDLIEFILVGPSSFPIPTRKALVSTLKSLGIEDAEDRVITTGIPLRI